MTKESAKPTVILICGYARAGKDTLARGIAQNCKFGGVVHRNFADALKESTNMFFEELGLDVNFYDESFKIKHRDVLVSFGKAARSFCKDIFAMSFVEFVQTCVTKNVYINELQYACSKMPPVICSDWRYANEFNYVFNALKDSHRIITVRVDTIGLLPANDEEMTSLAELLRECPLDYSFEFQPNSKDDILGTGASLAESLGL